MKRVCGKSGKDLDGTSGTCWNNEWWAGWESHWRRLGPPHLGLPMWSCQVTPESTPTKQRNRMELGPGENTAHRRIACLPLSPVDVVISQHTQRRHLRCERVPMHAAR
jgi:hypothetical protein